MPCAKTPLAVGTSSSVKHDSLCHQVTLTVHGNYNATMCHVLVALHRLLRTEGERIIYRLQLVPCAIQRLTTHWLLYV